MKTADAFERIGIADLEFHVRKNIEQCPRGLMLRELIRNAEEAAWLPEEESTGRRIEVRVYRVDEVNKLAVFNTGRGMDGDELVRATDLSCSIGKLQGLGGDENRGEGAKVASLPYNAAGMIFRSCRDGTVSQVTLRRVDNSYVRDRYEVVFEDGRPGYSAVLDVSEEALRGDYDLAIDWTEITLIGNHSAQDTTRWPYGELVGSGANRTVLSEIIDRFYDFAPAVRVRAQNHFHGRKGLMLLRPFGEAFTRHEREQDEPGDRIRRERVEIADGVVLEYAYLPIRSGRNNAMGAYELAGQPTRAAVVWRRECYDLHLGARWSRAAAQYGLPAVHAETSVFVLLPDDFPVRPGAYRAGLEYIDTREPVALEDFQALVRNHQPAWLGDLVAQRLAPRLAVDMSEVEAELAARLHRARQRLQAPAAGHTPAEDGIVTDDPLDEGGPDEPPAEPDDRHLTDPNARPYNRGGRRSRLPRTSARSLPAPRIVYLDTAAQVEGEQLGERAARYVEGTGTLFINALHDSIAGKIAGLQTHFGATHDLDRLRHEIVAAVRVDMALVIGTAVVTALAKSALRTWTEAHLRNAFSNESLTIAAESNELLLPAIRQRLAQRFHHLRRS